jgi:hypothetical protein
MVDALGCNMDGSCILDFAGPSTAMIEVGEILVGIGSFDRVVSGSGRFPITASLGGTVWM